MFLSSWKSLEGKCLDRSYVLQTLLDTGGFGAVFLAECLDEPAIGHSVCDGLRATAGLDTG
ncbi:hypothetical protein [Synechocystis salina]|uniref:Uncharacterized protein n=1 Tax=Synechocystis salina LEGE 00031 TaxID=1828736 RepID=A0ABR9VMY2_9SYNC|nr:hypothetical protein [Synechocystis salina]MBE9239668.1 hypothetical protein [Synechocystis salina LEGE 00041]MBE9252707.1 hypothetical protein [Synechocystis salina LEGE 00031]